MRGFIATSADAAVPPYAGAIDMHCHVFNADDLPIEGFIRRSFLHAGEGDLFDPPKALLGLVVQVVGRAAPSARREIEALGGSVGAAPGSGEARQDVVFESRLATGIERLSAIADGPQLFASPPTADEADVEPEDARALLGTLEELGGPLPGGDLPAGAPGLGASPSLRAPGALSRAINRRLRREADTPRGLQSVFGLSRTAGTVRRALAWARLMLSYRSTIISRYEALFGGPAGVSMITPALVDFEGWLGGGAASGSSLDLQVDAMSLLSRRQSGVLMHAIAPFDPLRDAISGKPLSFELVRRAVEEEGFVGVKLYPPMGFLPHGNADAEELDFADSIRRGRTREALARDLDTALARLFDWAGDPARRVPLLAHARDSYGGRPGYAVRARPTGWEGVMADKPALSVALAHFGDFDAASDGTVWETDMAQILARHPGAYADFSYLSSAMDEPDAEKQRKAEQLRLFADHSEQVLFGTDWSFIALARGHGDYLAGLDAQLERAGFGGGARRLVFRENAIRYLGLGADGPGRERLLAYYDRHGLDRNRLLAVIG